MPRPADTLNMRRLTMDLGDCTACEACTSLAPEYFGWDENMERPRQLQELVPRELAQELVSFCPQSCICFDDEESSGPRGY